jgi:signal transduction histidine kinase
MFAAIDTSGLSDEAKRALRNHAGTLARRTTLARRAETLSRAAAAALGVTVLVVAVILIGLSLQLARRWSAFFSAPIDELVRWVRLIQQQEPLPSGDTGKGAPEFAALRQALREMSEALDRARRQELERERLMAFRETARHVAHEIRGPLTALGLAVAQLDKVHNRESDAPDSALKVLRDEIHRLERMAREFSEFGRLPEGPDATVLVGELLESVLQGTVPDGMPLRRSVPADLVMRGHYEPLRRAVQNLVRNAVEVTSRQGIEITAERWENGSRIVVRIQIIDHGPGVPAEMRDQIFDPYFTTKELGTGLGLALVKQTVQAHGGTIIVTETPGGGATFSLEFPESA